jgi:hypothetical protein
MAGGVVCSVFSLIWCKCAVRAAVGGLEDVRCVLVGGPDGWKRVFVRQEGRRAVKVVAERGVWCSSGGRDRVR